MKKGIIEFAKQNPILTGIIAIVAITGIDNAIVNICKTVSYSKKVKAITEIETIESTEETD